MTINIPTERPEAEDIARLFAERPYGTATTSRSIIAGKPRSVGTVVVLAVQGDTLVYTTDGVWLSYATRNQWTDWALDVERPEPEAPVVMEVPSLTDEQTANLRALTIVVAMADTVNALCVDYLTPSQTVDVA